MLYYFAIHKIGLILVPNGELIGYALGDIRKENKTLVKTSSFRTSAKIIDGNELPEMKEQSYHTWGILFTILGTILLDFDADACQSPSRAYLLDVLLPGN